MRILALEASSKQMQVAIVIDDENVFQSVLDPAEGQTSTSGLSPMLSNALQAASLEPSQIDVLALTIGPGSFTSLRIACVTAKTWAYATGCRLVAIPTHDVIARQNLDEARRHGASRLWVLTDAQRRQLFVTQFEIPADDKNTTTNKSETIVLNPSEWQTQLNPLDAIAGAGVKLIDSNSVGRLCAEVNWTPRAITLATMARDRAERGEFDDFWTLKPFYVRPSAAEEKHRHAVSDQNQK